MIRWGGGSYQARPVKGWAWSRSIHPTDKGKARPLPARDSLSLRTATATGALRSGAPPMFGRTGRWSKVLKPTAEYFKMLPPKPHAPPNHPCSVCGLSALPDNDHCFRHIPRTKPKNASFHKENDKLPPPCATP